MYSILVAAMPVHFSTFQPHVCTMKKTLLFACLLAASASAQPPLRLWYTQPAKAFEETLVIGNGRMGATIYGGMDTDLIHLNDITLWSGEPVDPYMNKTAYTHLPAVREALAKEDYAAADTLIRKLQGKFSESYAPLGNLYLEFPHQSTGSYYRALSLDSALANVRYEADGNEIERSYFISQPDQVFVIRLHSKIPGKLQFTVRFGSLLHFTALPGLPYLHFRGSAPVRAEPNYVRKKGNPILFLDDRGTRFSAAIDVRHTGGKRIKTDSTITIEGADDAIVYVSLATSFNGFDKDPVKAGKPDKAIAADYLYKAEKKTWTQLLQRHEQDYRRFFTRVHFSLAGDYPEMPTDLRLQRYATGASDPYLEALYFQFGRYLLISSSRTPGVPANLQGLWNPYIQPPWSSNYTMNINAEENYWLAENTNLPEMHMPFLNFLGNLEKTGRITAKTFYNLPGWVCHHNSDIWAMTNPVGDFGNGQPQWANWPMGGAWASAQLWQYFQFTQDTAFLKNYGYPLMKGAAEFCLAYLVKDKKGDFITSPSTSPENVYITDKGFKGATFYGGTADLAIIRELLLDVSAAQNTLHTDDAMRQKIAFTLAHLHPYQVGKHGNLQEWYYDWQDADPKHRHQSHLYGLYPGTQISPEKTPALAMAAKRTLEIKGDETTGWSKGWRINLWARLKDGNHAYKMYRELLKYVIPDQFRPKGQNGGGTYPNLFDAHPPFQIDGNFGGAAAVAEMLLQSGPDGLQILPALPDAWLKGSISGLKARGGYTVSIGWEAGKLRSLHIQGKPGHKLLYWYQGQAYPVVLNSKGMFVRD